METGYAGNFYDLQARAILSGHLYVPNGSLNLEAWTYHGHQYTYFGVFPSLIRIPVLLLTHRLDGRLTASSLLLSWLITALFTSLSVWRVRVLLRSNSALGRTEAAALGLLVGTVLVGSVLVYLAAYPFVYSEDKAWSVALSFGGFFSLLGMLERPSRARMSLCAILILAANLTRLTEGYACIVGAVLVALWFALGRRGEQNRHWWVPLAIVASASLVIGCFISWAKSGSLFGLPVNEYSAFHVLNESAINGGRYFSPIYFPGAAYAYFQPGGMRLTSLFPFLTLPGGPTRVIGGVMFDNRTRTASVPASMPLLFLLSCIGVVAVFRRGIGSAVDSLRIILVSAASGTVAVLMYGWIANRYLADFLPFLVLSATIGLVWLWQILEKASSKVRGTSLCIVALIAIVSVVANVGLAITPNGSWNRAQATHFLEVQKAVSDVTGHPLSGQIKRGDSLPYWAPADTVFIAGRCEALYVSNGEVYSGILDQRAEHSTWVAVERGQSQQHQITVRIGNPSTVAMLHRTLIATMGTGRVWMQTQKKKDGSISVSFTLRGPAYNTTSPVESVEPGTSHLISLLTDQFADIVEVSFDGVPLVDSPVLKPSAPVIEVAPAASNDYLRFKSKAIATSMSLCEALERST